MPLKMNVCFGVHKNKGRTEQQWAILVEIEREKLNFAVAKQPGQRDITLLLKGQTSV